MKLKRKYFKIKMRNLKNGRERLLEWERSGTRTDWSGTLRERKNYSKQIIEIRNNEI